MNMIMRNGKREFCSELSFLILLINKKVFFNYGEKYIKSNDKYKQIIKAHIL